MDEAKIHPPSPSRIAEARASGLAPMPLLVGVAAALAALSLSSFGPFVRVEHALGSLLREPLAAWQAARPELAFGLAAQLLSELALQTALCLGTVLGCTALALALAQGFVIAWPRRSRRRFASPARSFVAPSLLALAWLFSSAFALRDAFWLTPAEVREWVFVWATRATLAAVGLAIADAAFARARFFRALWLTRREQREELREAFGAPELRSARDAARAGSAPGGERA